MFGFFSGVMSVSLLTQLSTQRGFSRTNFDEGDGVAGQPDLLLGAGGSDERPPELLDAAIIFATVGDLVPLALKAVRKGGRVVCAGIT